MVNAFCDYLNNLCPLQNHEDILFSTKILFYLSYLDVIHLELIFVYSVKWRSQDILSQQSIHPAPFKRKASFYPLPYNIYCPSH